MQDAIKHAERYFNGEQWFGDQSLNIGDRDKLEQDLRQIYFADYVAQWRDYLQKSVVVGYSSIPDAAKKLAMTASSPIAAARDVLHGFAKRGCRSRDRQILQASARGGSVFVPGPICWAHESNI